MTEDDWRPVTFDSCDEITGPFYHGTRITLAVGDVLSPGFPSNYERGRTLSHVYFSADLEPAIWGAELAMALAGSVGRGSIYVVQPTGPFEDDPNLTNKRFPGNPTRSYRSREPLLIVGKVDSWWGHTEDAIDGMLASLRELRRGGHAIIED